MKYNKDQVYLQSLKTALNTDLNKATKWTAFKDHSILCFQFLMNKYFLPCAL